MYESLAGRYRRTSNPPPPPPQRETEFIKKPNMTSPSYQTNFNIDQDPSSPGPQLLDPRLQTTLSAVT